jgi:hypothetical protein
MWIAARLFLRFASVLKAGRRSDRSRRGALLALEALEDRRVLNAAPAVTFAVTQDWGSGFQAQVTITDPAQGAPVNNWQLAFDYAAQISSIWDATIVSHTGNHYVIQNAGWNSTLAPGGAVAFGFIGSPGNTTAQPTSYLLDGIPLGAAPLPLPTLSIGNTSVTEPASGTTTASFAVTLSAASATPVTVQWQTQNGTALAGADYQSASGTLTFAPGQTQQNIVVTIDHDNSAAPGNLTFHVNLSNPGGATLAVAQAIGTIAVPTPPPPAPAGNIQFQDTTDWGSGFTGQITIKNPGSTAINNWSLGFDFSGQITSIWNALITSHNGDHYVVSGASWNASIAAGASVSFGFNGSPGNLTSAQAPTNFVLVGNGGPISDGGSGTANAAPTAVNDTAFTLQNQPVTIAVLTNDSDADGDTLSVASVGTAQHGSVVKNADNTVTYTPAPGYLGNDSFSYVLSDGHGNTASATVAVTVSAPVASSWPQNVFAPYVDATAWPPFDFVAAARTAGIKYFTLAFIVAGPNGEAAWGGYQAYDVSGSSFSNTMQANINSLRAQGGDVRVSFGGAAGQELAQVITSVPALTSAYQSVITTYGLTHIDFDIEGAAVADRASIDRRSQAIAALQQQAAVAGKVLDVTFTLPVLPTGLTADGLYVLQSALKYGVKIGGVNIMTMDYGDSAAPNPQGQMGTYAIDAATSLFAQLQGLYATQLTAAQLWHMVGITPMIGVNDVSTEVFTQQDAQQVLTFARQHNIGQLSMWSLNRDQSGGSGITQQGFEFSTIFEPFTS